MKKKPLPIGISDFKKLIDGGFAYVDKTLLVQEILEKGTEVALIPRLRRFGKTLNLSMLRYFFEKTEEDTSYLFKGLKIWQNGECRAMQGQFPVVFITFKDIKHSSMEETFEHFRILLSEEFERHRYLLESEILSAEEKSTYHAILRKEGNQPLCEQSLRLLIKWMYLYHKKQIILLIDEYDAPAHAAYVGKYYQPLIEFLRNLLSGCLKDSSHLKRGVLTGILRIAKESIFSGLNNVRPFTILNEAFNDKFGLLESEVIELLEAYDLTCMLPEMRQWYDGYRIGSCVGIYNPWSVLNCIEEKGILDSYWVNTSDNALMKQLITQGSEDLKVGVEELLKGGIVEKNIEEGILFSDLEQSPNAVWSLLLFSGYLTIDSAPSPDAPCRLRIPNVEVGKLYQSMISNWFEKTIHLSQYHMLLNSLISGDVHSFSLIFQEFLISSASVFDITPEEPEKIYHAFILGMLIGLKDRYEVKSIPHSVTNLEFMPCIFSYGKAWSPTPSSCQLARANAKSDGKRQQHKFQVCDRVWYNRESGYGRYDVLLIPKNGNDLGIIMEFKKVGRFEKTDLETAATSALKQIEDMHYAQELLDRDINRILYLGFAFKGKNVLIIHKFRNE